ncbi:unnamed protein product, partial [Larinioides sclopetarius]
MKNGLYFCCIPFCFCCHARSLKLTFFDKMIMAIKSYYSDINYVAFSCLRTSSASESRNKNLPMSNRGLLYVFAQTLCKHVIRFKLSKTW